MKKQRKIQLLLISILTMMTGFMLVGFAAYSEELKISGTTGVSNSKWSVHFDQAGLNEQLNGEALRNSINVDEVNNIINFDVTLNKFGPSASNVVGDGYSIRLPIVNDGTFDAKIISAEIAGLSAAQSKYCYAQADIVQAGLSGEPDESTAQIIVASRGQLPQAYVPVTLAQGKKAYLKFGIFLITPELASDLPATGAKLSVTLKLNVEQSEE